MLELELLICGPVLFEVGKSERELEAHMWLLALVLK